MSLFASLLFSCATVLVKAAVMLALAITAAGSDRGAAHDRCPSSANGAKCAVFNPYDGVRWENVEYIHSFSHQHVTGRVHILQALWDMGFRHLAVSDYYPSRPAYPLPDTFLKRNPEAIGAPNAEHHNLTDSNIHFNSLGSFYATGYGEIARINHAVSPVEHIFTELNVFDAADPGPGVYRLDIRLAPKSAGSQAAAVMTVEGALELDPRTLKLVGSGQVRKRHLDSKWRGSIYLRAERDNIRVHVERDPASTQIVFLRLMQGTNRPWREAFSAALDGTLKDAQGRSVEGLLFPEGGGITINHPVISATELAEMLDFDPRVLGIEAWNHRRGFGGEEMRFYNLWNDALGSGRRCFGFFVKDHIYRGRGRNVLLLPPLAGLSREDRERVALRAYREGRFFGLLGAMAIDKEGKETNPYDLSHFRFARFELRRGATGFAEGVEVAVAGADKTVRPNTQIRFITDAGVAAVAHDDEAFFPFPRAADGSIACVYVRVEAFAFPDTHLNGKALTQEAVSSMNVWEIARLHDRFGELSKLDVDHGKEGPVPIVDMIFSQAVMTRPRSGLEIRPQQ